MKNKYLTNIKISSLEDCLYSILSRYAIILFINNEDFEQLNLDDFTTDYFFIVENAVPKGRIYHVTDEDFKKQIYEFYIKENSKKVFRGRK